MIVSDPYRIESFREFLDVVPKERLVTSINCRIKNMQKALKKVLWNHKSNKSYSVLPKRLLVLWREVCVSSSPPPRFCSLYPQQQRYHPVPRCPQGQRWPFPGDVSPFRLPMEMFVDTKPAACCIWGKQRFCVKWIMYFQWKKSEETTFVAYIIISKHLSKSILNLKCRFHISTLLQDDRVHSQAGKNPCLF